MRGINIQPGHIARHTPRNAGAQGREAAVVDVAQDLLLQHLHEEGELDFVAIKGGTAIRKLYAGKEGRFSLDLDFSVSEFGLDRDEVAAAFAGKVDGLSIDPFRYGVRERRGKWSVVFEGNLIRNPPSRPSSTSRRRHGSNPLNVRGCPWRYTASTQLRCPRSGR